MSRPTSETPQQPHTPGLRVSALNPPPWAPQDTAEDALWAHAANPEQTKTGPERVWAVRQAVAIAVRGCINRMPHLTDAEIVEAMLAELAGRADRSRQDTVPHLYYGGDDLTPEFDPMTVAGILEELLHHVRSGPTSNDSNPRSASDRQT